MHRSRALLTLSTGYAEISIVVNSAPYGGHIDATPRTGTAASDAFLLESLGWTDEADDLPIVFSFAYAHGYVRTVVPLSWCWGSGG